jgi:putative copper export protein
MRFVYYLHLLGAAVWVGGLIVVAILVPVIRRLTDDVEVVRAVARRFGTVSWVALGVQVTTGTIMILDRAWTGPLAVKIGLVMISAMLAVWHAVAAREQRPATRGAIQGGILTLGLVIVWVATYL